MVRHPGSISETGNVIYEFQIIGVNVFKPPRDLIYILHFFHHHVLFRLFLQIFLTLTVASFLSLSPILGCSPFHFVVSFLYLGSCYSIFIIRSSPILLVSFHPSAAPPSLDTPALYSRPHAPPPLPALLHEHLPCPTDTTRCSHPPKTTSNRQHHQRPQSVSQAVSQPASKAAIQPAFCFDLKLLSSPVTGLLSSSDTHQRSS